MTNAELDELLQRELPGYESVFAVSGGAAEQAVRARAAFRWARLGRFRGWPSLEWRGPRKYFYRPAATDAFAFMPRIESVDPPSAIEPGELVTDAGSIPRVAWSIPGLSPWDYLPAYLVHDWDFEAHHRGIGERTFEEINLTLAEGIYTLMRTGVAHSDWVRIEIIYRAVSSDIGRAIWDRSEG